MQSEPGQEESPVFGNVKEVVASRGMEEDPLERRLESLLRQLLAKKDSLYLDGHLKGNRHLLQLRALEKAHAKMARREKYHRVVIEKLLKAFAARWSLTVASHIVAAVRAEHYPKRAKAT